jgi:glycosyltransferase involved in cell wall biosynthesis
VRVANYVPFLREHAIELEHLPTLSDKEYRLIVSSGHRAQKATVLARSAARAASQRQDGARLLVHRLLTLIPVPGIDPPRRLDAYDFDDALLVGSAGDSNRRFQWMKREGRRALACIRHARLVLAANGTLADEARPYAQRVEVVPSCVDPATQPLHDHAGNGSGVIGWIGSHTTVGYLRPLLPIVQRLNARGCRARLVVVGADTGFRADWIEHRPWSLGTEARDLSDFDVGVMPLPDTPWTRGKSGYKLLQYFSAGVPAVASPVGVNAQLIGDGRGLAATTADDWERGLVELLADETGRTERGSAARRLVEDHYSYQRWSPELAALLHGLGG